MLHRRLGGELCRASARAAPTLITDDQSISRSGLMIRRLLLRPFRPCLPLLPQIKLHNPKQAQTMSPSMYPVLPPPSTHVAPQSSKLSDRRKQKSAAEINRGKIINNEIFVWARPETFDKSDNNVDPDGFEAFYKSHDKQLRQKKSSKEEVQKAMGRRTPNGSSFQGWRRFVFRRTAPNNKRQAHILTPLGMHCSESTRGSHRSLL
mmetsp:Transcript_3995/g.8851  ORF Transcript_3995/g.8851 Transcript_3995/m.8851 type:complete len:206 (+) Transcript_3995:229-846(+)